MEPGANPSKVVCVGRNYLAHARELGSEIPTRPLLFLKPPSAIIRAGDPIHLPADVGRVDFEGEIAFVVGKRARHVPKGEGWGYISYVLPANDITARELQRAEDQWTRAKGFDSFLPLGRPVPISEVPIEALSVTTRLNGEVVQDAPLSDAVFSPGLLVEYVSRTMTLEPGDLILTGTPSGVGPLRPGDEVEVTVAGVGSVANPVVAATGPDD
ncbi:MAG: fumarylacetoacetate hydrolase family protein [Gemmatimonadota bacterium]